ncbi:hypothetical protein M8868_11330 [Pasteurella multocida]|uniref:Uncharacterized protein n=1 Tax=Pasteurella multocida TaxID=747 RepID=A0A9X3ZMD2_PASMD|nr:hypothetical protein [Pasteurella multocida]MCL7770180.1 hypothetical protein [Pasteurella multocida]MCL7774864.1 hypothetical protein [Pasteurella multocida]MCL7783468.1 hypothetical protein [Pasteurella multocida]MDA5609304.1 hypothetical protein [Pasteurella multocida subsp. multocida]MDA5616823.1 hypothetical protein [Pasteurella multocida]
MEPTLNGDELSISFPQQLYYSTTKPIHVSDVIKSLSGLNTLVKSTKPTLNTLLESDICNIELFVKTIEEGSLLEETFIKLFFNSQAEYDAFLKKIHDKFGDKAMKTTGAIILAVVGLFTLYGMYKAATASADNGTINNQSFNTINNYYLASETWENAAKLTDMSPQDIKRVVEHTIRNRKAVAQGAIDVMSPTKDDENAELFIGQNHKTEPPIIPREVVKATPHGKIEFSSIEDVVDYNDIDIQIRALDLDNPKKGWAGIIPNVIDYRVRIEVAKGINTNKLKINKTVRADVSVELKKDSATGELKATKILLHKLR